MRRSILILLIALITGLVILGGGYLWWESALRSCVVSGISLSGNLILIGAAVSVGSSAGLAIVSRGRRRFVVAGSVLAIGVVAFVAISGFVFGLCGSF